MVATIHPFPSPGAGAGAGAPSPRPLAPSRRRYAFADMVRLLALDGAEPRTQVDYLRKLAVQRHMPLPLNPRQRGGCLLVGPDAIGRRSLWCAMEVDAWLDSLRSPPGAALAMPVTSPAVRHDMLARARQLASGR